MAGKPGAYAAIRVSLMDGLAATRRPMGERPSGAGVLFKNSEGRQAKHCRIVHSYLEPRFRGGNEVKVSIKDLAVSMDLGNTGVTMDVYDNDDRFLGDLRIGRGTIEWCKGRTRAGNGVKKNWSQLIAFFEDPK
jgi:hypothetical protein